jgi:dihydroorotate dehydrogenase (fumarate)
MFISNVLAFSQRLSSHADERLRAIRIVGVGGVRSYQTAQHMFKAGASVVACATALGKEGVGVFERFLTKS